MGNSRKLTAITLISLLVSVALLGSGWITQEVAAIDLDQAIDLEAAPHFRDLTYTVGKPSYATAFDELGSWKVSVGNPKLAIVKSALSITAPSVSHVRMTLTAADATGLNVTGRSTIQAKVVPANVTAQYTNVTIAANSDASDLITVMFHDSTASVIYSNGASTTSSTLYAPVEDGASYVIAFELAESGSTVYLYDSSGDLLANKLLDVADVHAGTVHAVHIGVSGLASGSVLADYMFVTTTVTDRAWSEISVPVMRADSAAPAKSVEVDPTKLKMIRSDSSITTAAYGMDALASEGDDVAAMFASIGSTAEPSQRFKGQFVAVGWEDFRGSVETSLKAQIARSLGILDPKEVHIVDYYIDYLQLKTSMDQRVVDNQLASYRASMYDAFKAMGIPLTDTDARVISASYSSTPMVLAGTSTMSILPPGATQFSWATDLASIPLPAAFAAGLIGMNNEERAEWLARTSAGINLNPMKGIEDIAKDAVGKIPDWSEVANYTDQKLQDMYRWTTGAVKEGLSSVQQWVNATYLSLYNHFSSETARWNAVLNATMEQYASMSKETLAAMTGFFGSTVNDISAKYQSMNDRLANLNSEYMNWSNAMMVNTNAMFTQLIYDLSEQSAATQRYFMDQVTRGNEAVANISDSIALSASQTNAIFADLLKNGKVTKGEGLSFGAFLGNGSYTTVIVLVAVISMVAVVAVIILMGGRKKSARKRR